MALPTYEQHLLPPNASHLERVLAAAGERMTLLPCDIDLLKRPFDVPFSFLPHLAFEYSVDVWEKSWPETRMRSVTDDALLIQFKKGTAYYLRTYARYADAEVTKITSPPQRIYSGAAMTKAQREAWLRRLPQVRVWLHFEEGFAPPAKMFIGSGSPGRMRSACFIPEGACATPSTALERLKRRARWIINGVEQDVTVTDFEGYYRLHFPSVIGDRVFSNQPIGKRYYIPSGASKRLVTIRPTLQLPWRAAATPSLEPATLAPELVFESGTAGASVFSGDPLGNYFVPSTAWKRIYHRYAVFDGTRAYDRNPVQYMGDGRYGFPPHAAWVALSIPSTQSIAKAGYGFHEPKIKFWLPHNHERTEKVRRAIEASRRLSDKIGMVLGPKPRFVADGQPVLADIDTVIVGRP